MPIAGGARHQVIPCSNDYFIDCDPLIVMYQVAMHPVMERVWAFDAISGLEQRSVGT